MLLPWRKCLAKPSATPRALSLHWAMDWRQISDLHEYQYLVAVWIVVAAKPCHAVEAIGEAHQQ
jgi:hypothetical protein